MFNELTNYAEALIMTIIYLVLIPVVIVIGVVSFIVSLPFFIYINTLHQIQRRYRGGIVEEKPDDSYYKRF